jgi:uncharacterized membrane protein
MEPLVISLVLLSAVMHALRNFFNKKALDKQAFIWWYEVFGLLFFAPVFFFTLVRQDVNVSISWTYIFLSGIVHFFYWYFLSSALKKGDLSFVYPIMRSSPALVLFFSMTILKEDISALGFMGILLVVLGVYAIDIQKFALSELLKPFRSLKQDWAVRFAFLTLLSSAAYSLVDKLAVSVMNPVIFAFIYPWVSLGLLTIYMFRAKDRGVLAKEWRVHKGSILLCGVLSIFGYFLILVAFTLERVSYIVGLRQVSIVFAVLLGGHFLKEGNRFSRTLFSIVIFMGCYFIAIAGG